jgi:hypothetical protein
MSDGTQVIDKLTRICTNQTSNCKEGYIGYNKSSQTVKIIYKPKQVKTTWSQAESLDDWWSGTREEQQQLHTGLQAALRDYRQNREPPVNFPRVESLEAELDLVDQMVLSTPAW